MLSPEQKLERWPRLRVDFAEQEKPQERIERTGEQARTEN